MLCRRVFVYATRLNRLAASSLNHYRNFSDEHSSDHDKPSTSGLTRQDEEKPTSSISEKLAKPRQTKSAAAENDADAELTEQELVQELVGEEMGEAVENVADYMGGDKNKTRLDLVKKMVKPAEAEGTKSFTDLKSLVSQMQFDAADIERIERQRQQSTAFRSTRGRRRRFGSDRLSDDQREMVDRGAKPFRQQLEGVKDGREDELGSGTAKGGPQRIPKLFQGPRLGIFSPGCAEADPSDQPTQMPVWRRLEAERRQKLATIAARNGFEEMIQWTKEGKLWHYPIDNEWNWQQEKGVGFHEHIFLEGVVDEMDFPKTGPIRVFMEMVCTGLSKNPWMSVEKKRDHIRWFREYFDGKIEDIERLHKDETADLKRKQELL